MTKRILITGGPTNSYANKTMKIAGISDGKYAIQMAEEFATDDYYVILLLNKAIKYVPAYPNIVVHRFDTMTELKSLIEQLSAQFRFDAVVHSAVVTDYVPQFTVKLEELSYELAEYMQNHITKPKHFKLKECADDIFDILTNPECSIAIDSSISADEPNIAIKFDASDNLVSYLKKCCENAMMCCFKSFDVANEQLLIGESIKTIEEWDVEMLFVNDVDQIMTGESSRWMVTKDASDGLRVSGTAGVAHAIKQRLDKKAKEEKSKRAV